MNEREWEEFWAWLIEETRNVGVYDGNMDRSKMGGLLSYFRWEYEGKNPPEDGHIFHKFGDEVNQLIWAPVEEVENQKIEHPTLVTRSFIKEHVLSQFIEKGEEK